MNSVVMSAFLAWCPAGRCREQCGAVLLLVVGLFAISGCESKPPAATPPDQQLVASSSESRRASSATDTRSAVERPDSGADANAAAAATSADTNQTDNRPPLTAEESHARMLAELARLGEDALENHPFVGQRGLRDAQQELDTYGATAEPLDRSRMHGVLGQELLRAGRTNESIEHTLEAVRLLEENRGQVPPEVLQRAVYLLAIAYLRDGEDTNCVHCINGERCLFPIRGQGVHEHPHASQQAVKYLRQALEMNPQDLGARWLLNVAYMTLGEYPQGVPQEHRIDPERFGSAPSPVGEFRNLARDLGLNVLGCAGGVVADDLDGDLDIDLMFSSWSPDGQLRYFRNNGDGSFTECTEEANLNGIFGGLNLIHADYDNDGDLDVLVLRGGWLERAGRYPNSLLQNDGTGRFLDVTFAVGLGNQFLPTQTASWADYDLDGDLDLYIGNEGFPAEFYRNDGPGKFVDVTRQAGLTNPGLAKGVVWGDYDNDGWPDLYISHYPGANRLLQNRGDGTFRDVAQQARVMGPYSSFPTWFWDYNNDGHLDLFVASYQPGLPDIVRDYLGQPIESEPDALYRGTKEGVFEEVAAPLGLTRVTQPMGVNFGDIDNDGFLDFYLGTGFVDYEGLIPNLLFHNQGGEKFADITFSANVGHLQKGHGVAFADLDHDGDEDLIGVMGGWFAGDAFAKVMFENPGCGNHWLSVRLIGQKSNRYGVGCRIRAVVGQEPGREIYRTVSTGGTFGSNPLRTHLGLGKDEVVRELEVYWPASQTRQVFHDLPAGHYVEIIEGVDQYQAQKLPAMKFQTAPEPSPTEATGE